MAEVSVKAAQEGSVVQNDDTRSLPYEFIPASPDTERLTKYAHLLSAVFPNSSKYSPEFMRWQYVNNPYGKVVGFDAWDGATLAAHYATIPVVYNVRGAILKGLLSLNTATHPSHQGKGLFTKLAQRTYEAAATQGFHFVIGVANSNSTPGFIKKLGFTLLAPLEVKVGFGTIRTSQQPEGVRAIRSDQYWDWRLSCPSSVYLRRGDHVVAPTEYPMVYAQLCSLEKEISEAAGLKKASLVNATVWIGNNKSARAHGVLTSLPDKFKPSPLNFILKSLSKEFIPFSADELEFDLIDFDAY